MEFSALLKQLDNFTEENKNMFTNKNTKDISGILYFDQDEYQSNPNFLQNNDKNSLYVFNVDNMEKNTTENDYKKLSFNVKIHIDINKYNLSMKYNNLTECLMNVLDFYNYNAKKLFFKELLREFDIYKLYKKFNYKKLVKKTILRKSLIKNNDNDSYVRQLLSDYLNINLIIFSNNEIKTYCKENHYEMYRPSIFIYKYNNTFQYLSNKKDIKIFTSDDKINIVFSKYFYCKEIIKRNIEKEQKIIENKKQQEKQIKKEQKIQQTKLVNFSKMKVNDLRNLCKQYHIATTEIGKNGKVKNIIKKVLIEKLKLVLA